MQAIKDLEGYLQRMEHGLEDKLWWLSKTKMTTVVDFGCADGTLLKHLSVINPELTLIGVDNSSEMLELAKNNVPTAIFMTDDEFFHFEKDFKNSILILSSVVHEIYSYDEDAENTIYHLMHMGFGEIAIRDMFISKKLANKLANWRDYTYVIHHSDERQLKDFESIWGHTNTIENLIHFLLKYRYVNNWDREVKENYLPIYLEDFLKKIDDTYAVEYIEHYVLPYLKEIVWNDFHINLQERTHCKILLRPKSKAFT